MPVAPFSPIPTVTTFEQVGGPTFAMVGGPPVTARPMFGVLKEVAVTPVTGSENVTLKVGVSAVYHAGSEGATDAKVGGVLSMLTILNWPATSSAMLPTMSAIPVRERETVAAMSLSAGTSYAPR